MAVSEAVAAVSMFFIAEAFCVLATVGIKQKNTAVR
jgi:hypothetical protein